MLYTLLLYFLVRISLDIFAINLNLWLIIIFWISVNILDVHSTYLFLKNGRREGNPIFAFLFKKIGFGRSMVIKAGLVLFTAYLVLINKNYYSQPILAWSIVFVFIVIDNYNLGRKDLKE